VADTVIHALGEKSYSKTQYCPQRHCNITVMEGCVLGCLKDGGINPYPANVENMVSS